MRVGNLWSELISIESCAQLLIDDFACVGHLCVYVWMQLMAPPQKSVVILVAGIPDYVHDASTTYYTRASVTVL